VNILVQREAGNGSPPMDLDHSIVISLWYLWRGGTVSDKLGWRQTAARSFWYLMLFRVIGFNMLLSWSKVRRRRR